jgi:hypothetical protein
MVSTFYSFFTGMMIVFILHFLAKHYLLHISDPPDSRDSRDSPPIRSRKRVHFNTTPEIYEIPFIPDETEDIHQSRSPPDLKRDLIQFAKDYQETSEDDDLAEFFQVAKGVHYDFDASPSNISRSPSPNNGVIGCDSMDMLDSFTAL